ncbi:MAG TPA: DUF3325 domain-containing protein [Ramlibacter sp.]|jgi:TRAP-type C4-dicarboxylate transport system permease small subunit|uniref:DUF3325 domain-containing protein n=1 Tax=Ramlibacter sp. TaxID=1917967 RepID=UPI002D5AC699|nr:DUF3325 domain-containing protein [Ramlibacter sp.]HZY18992.1 DUF3325 domain-containing protein [Ramlibacter sp.]
MTHALTLLLCVAAFAALALGSERQQDDLFGRALPRTTTRGLRAAATLLLLAALAVPVTAHGWALALVMYSGHTSLAAGLVYAALIVRLRRARQE